MTRTIGGLLATIVVTFGAGCPGYLDDSLPDAETDQQAVVFGFNEFGFELFDEVDKGDDNMALSPFSIATALSMAYAGAEGDTSEQMADVLGLGLSQDQLHPLLGDLNVDLDARHWPELDQNGDQIDEDQEGELILDSSNSAWLKPGFPFTDAWIDVLEADHGTEVNELSFDDKQAAVDVINAWVEGETQGLIDELMTPDLIDENTIFALINALYFYGSWESEFRAGQTQDRDFTTLAGNVVDVPTMEHQHNRYLRGTRFKATVLPYVDGNLSMVLILPDRGQFKAVEKDLSAGGLYSVMANMERHEVDLRLPRFELDSDIIDLEPHLQDMGMELAFDDKQADFSALYEPTFDGRVYISHAVHRAVIKVDETGTEAAAATAVVGAMVGSAGGPAPQPKKLYIDRPFLFAIVDERTDTVLFIGRVADPR